MKFLKGLGTFVCSFLLFLALTIFALAYMLHSTVLSSDFVNKQVNRIDISSIARDVAEKQIGKELPEEATILKDVAYNVIAEQQPWIKQQLNNAVDTGYDYFLGKSSALTITITLVDLKASLSSSMWDAAKKYLQQKLSGITDNEITQYLQDFINQFPEDTLPAGLAILPRDIRNIAIEQFLRGFAGQKLILGLPPEITAPVQLLVKPYFDDYMSGFIDQIPDSYSIDASTIGPDGMNAITTARKYIDYYQSWYYVPIAVMVVMAGLIFLINRNVKTTTRTLGIDLLIFGVLDGAGAIVSKLFTPTQFIKNTSDIPVSVQNIIDNVYEDVTNIALRFSIGVLVIGVILVVVSFIMKSRQAED